MVRPTINNGSDEATAATNEPAARVESEMTNTRFLPNMSPSRPAIGVATAAASRNEVKTQATPDVEVCRSRWSTGSAGATSV